MVDEDQVHKDVRSVMNTRIKRVEYKFISLKRFEIFNFIDGAKYNVDKNDWVT